MQKELALQAKRQEINNLLSLEGEASQVQPQVTTKPVDPDLTRAIEMQNKYGLSPRAANYQQKTMQHNLGYSSLYFDKLLLEKQQNPKMGVYSHLKYAQHQFQK